MEAGCDSPCTGRASAGGTGDIDEGIAVVRIEEDTVRGNSHPPAVVVPRSSLWWEHRTGVNMES